MSNSLVCTEVTRFGVDVFGVVTVSAIGKVVVEKEGGREGVVVFEWVG